MRSPEHDSKPSLKQNSVIKANQKITNFTMA